jgi:acetyl-CoA C-acetyltransferase
LDKEGVLKKAVIVSGVRTPIGMHGGVFRDLPAQEMARVVLAEALARSGIDPHLVDDVILGCISQQSDAPNIGRVAALLAGIPVHIPGCTIQRNCVSGMMALTMACQAIQAGDGEVFLCGGVESMSTAPYMVRGARWGLRLRHQVFLDTLWEGLTDPVCDQLMGLTAENLAMMYGISREAQDRFAVQSHRKAWQASSSGLFNTEIVPVPVQRDTIGSTGQNSAIDKDEGINPDLSLQKAALYPAIFKQGGTVTPANACPISDGAAAAVVMTSERARDLGVKPRAIIRGYAYAAVPPEIMGIGPAYAVPRALDRAGLNLSDIELIELNEAFAAQALAVGQELAKEGWDWSKVNVNGGAIALGHPVGCTGTRLIVTLLHTLEQRDLTLGLATACVGGGMGGAMILERC